MFKLYEILSLTFQQKPDHFKQENVLTPFSQFRGIEQAFVH